MNILFVYAGPIIPERGGVRRVTRTLADYFEGQGHKVCFLSSAGTGPSEDARQRYLPVAGSSVSAANVTFFRELLVREAIDIVVNQCGLGGDMNSLAFMSHEFGVSLVSCVHSTLLGSVRNVRYAKYDRLRRVGLQWLAPLLQWPPANGLLVAIYKLRYRAHFDRMSRHSDRVVLLSEQIKEEMAEYLGQCPPHVVAMPNPIRLGETVVAPIPAGQLILWVGRVDYAKRLDYLLEAWRELSLQFPKWRIVVVGDGPCLNSARSYVVKHSLTRVEFTGQVEASPYYADAAILSFTSAYEGFPMVLLEAMAAGCVPIAFDSFLAAPDIIDDEVNGVLVPAFDVRCYIAELGKLMIDAKWREQLALAAREKVRMFDLSVVGTTWIKMFESVLGKP